MAFGNRLLRFVEDVLYVGIATLLAVGAAILLLAAARQVVTAVSANDVGAGMLEVLDSLLLVFIFAELLFAVRSTIAERRIVAEPFLIVGILAAIKEIVVLSVKAADILDKGPEFARAAVEIGILGGLVLVLALSAVLLRRKEREPEETANSSPGQSDEAAQASRG